MASLGSTGLTKGRVCVSESVVLQPLVVVFVFGWPSEKEQRDQRMMSMNSHLVNSGPGTVVVGQSGPGSVQMMLSGGSTSAQMSNGGSPEKNVELLFNLSAIEVRDDFEEVRAAQNGPSFGTVISHTFTCNSNNGLYLLFTRTENVPYISASAEYSCKQIRITS